MNILKNSFVFCCLIVFMASGLMKNSIFFFELSSLVMLERSGSGSGGGGGPREKRELGRLSQLKLIV